MGMLWIWPYPCTTSTIQAHDKQSWWRHLVAEPASAVTQHKQWVCRVPQALGKDKNTLGKRFVECNTRQIAHDIYSVGERLFA